MATTDRRTELQQTIRHLTSRWAQVDRQVLKHVFPLLARGLPVTKAPLVEASGKPAVVIDRALESGRVGLDADDRIEELFGVQLKPTLHRVELDSAILFTCCALVAHVVPRLLGRTVRVISTDPISQAVCRIRIGRDGLEAVEPEAVVATMIVTDAVTIHEDAPLHFCDHVHHFASGDTAAAFVAGNRKRYTIRLEELDAAAEALYAAIWE